MSKPDNTAFLNEAKSIGGRVSTIAAEYCDAWLFLGVRVGGEKTYRVQMAEDPLLARELENQILTLAAEIARERHAAENG